MAVASTDETRRPLHPDQRLEEVIASNLDVFGCASGFASTENDVLSTSFEEVIDDFVGAHGLVAQATRDRLRIAAGTGHRNTVKVTEERIDHCKIRTGG